VTEAIWQEIASRVELACTEAGLDLVHPFQVGRYNDAAPEADRLDDLGRPDALGILIGNTRKLWPAFTLAFQTDALLASGGNPLDTYVTTRVSKILSLATTQRTRIVMSHVTVPRAFPIQRLAESVGLAAISPSRLAIHPLHGPWFALRAVVVVDVAGPAAAPGELERPCRDCSAPCLSALERALAASGSPLSSAAVALHAAEWIAVRDACPVGPSSRYGAAQLAYHYAPARSRIIPEA
jgi:methylmalonic aciduria homocystinuria type C protein